VASADGGKWGDLHSYCRKLGGQVDARLTPTRIAEPHEPSDLPSWVAEPQGPSDAPGRRFVVA
jgi:hypothetical protein